MTSTGFPAGVASFDPTVDAVIIWTLLGSAGSCSWEVAADEEFIETVASGVATCNDGSRTVAVDVGGLSAGRTFWYRFSAAGSTSPIGRTRTLPGRHPDRLRLGVTCCARFGQAHFDVYRELASTDVDLVVHLGDYIYEDTKCEVGGREPDPPEDCVTLDDYRRRHLQCRRDPDLQRLHQRHPMVVIWDDHDIADNAYRGGAANHDPQSQGPWADRIDAALAAHHEFLPKRLAEPGDPTTPWRRLDAGDLVALVCTETRAHRDEQAGREGATPADDPERTVFGRSQRQWLVTAVEDPGPSWTIVLSGTVASELSIDAPARLDGLLPEKYTVHDGRAINTDQWDGYLADRGVLAAAARRRGGRTIVLSGDIHSSWAIEGPADDQGAVAVEFTCPPAATTPLGRLLPPGGAAVLSDTVTERLDTVRWMSGEHRGFLTVDLARDRAQISYWWVVEGADPLRLGRRWEVAPSGLPARLVDPEPDRSAPRSPRWRIASLDGAAAEVGPVVVAALAGAAVASGVVAGAAAARRRRPPGRQPAGSWSRQRRMR